MIIKILSSAKNFAGIVYNDKKNDLGESELLCAENFGGLSFQSEITRADYVNYMKAISSLNPRVKNKQFHAVISVKGKQGNPGKLVDVGKQYLDKMGYGQNPFLIYHHGDTANAHIHIISTRVDKNGHKVDDTFEKLRSQKVMHEILNRDPEYEADHCIRQALAYRFSTEAQFRLLLELSGFTIRAGVNGLELIKYGEVQRRVEDDLVTNRIAACKIDQKRARQLNAIFSKYAIGLSEAQWIKLAKDKFGIDLVFHRKDKATTPYGYTIVDHAAKHVFKGSQVLKLAELYGMASEARVRNIVADLCARPDISFAQLQKELDGLGLSLSEFGSVHRGERIWKLPADQFRALKYADRLELAASFTMNSRQCFPVLGKLLLVDPRKISTGIQRNEALQVLVNYLNEKGQWKEGLKHYGFSLMQHKGEVYMLSAKDRQLNALKDMLTAAPSFDLAHVPHLQLTDEPALLKASQPNLLSVLADLMPESSLNREAQQDKRKRRQINY